METTKLRTTKTYAELWNKYAKIQISHTFETWANLRKWMAFFNSESKKNPKILGETSKAEKIQTQACVILKFENYDLYE